VLAVALLAGGCSRPDNAVKAAATPAVPVQVATATRQDMPRRIESIGTVQAIRSVTVKSQVDGIIAEIKFTEGEEVKAGDPLVVLDRRPFQNSLNVAHADLVNARAEAAQADVDVERYKSLNQQDAISKEQYSVLLTKAQTTHALVQAKEAAVANAELQLGYTEIKAPISGRTGQLMLHEGALVKANDNTFPIVTINQLAPISIAYGVPEKSLDEIRGAVAGQQVTVTAIDRTSGLQRDRGQLGFVDNTVDASTGMITLKAIFDNADKAFWPGRFVNVVTQVGIDRGATVVPATAVQTSQNGSSIFVLKADQTVDLRNVKILRTAGDVVLIAEGVQPGETVVTDGQLRLLPGMKAEPKTLAGTPVVSENNAPAHPNKT
jgi:membrane fusion protein, multidrug efflux system